MPDVSLSRLYKQAFFWKNGRQPCTSLWTDRLPALEKTEKVLDRLLIGDVTVERKQMISKFPEVWKDGSFSYGIWRG